MVDDLWDGGLKERFEGKKSVDGRAKPGPKPKADHKVMLRVLILDLYVAWLEDPVLCVGISKNVNSWKAGSRYNALHLSKSIIKVMEALEKKGFIDVAPGSYAEPGAPTNRTTRIRASEELWDIFSEVGFSHRDIGRAEDEEVIILKTKGEKLDNARKGGRKVEYEDTETTIRMRDDLRAYNLLIASCFADIPSLEEPVLAFDRAKPETNVRIGADYSRTRRIFNRESWEMGGRYYGGWWQRIGEDWRSQIAINNQPTVEVDFKGLHVAMLYAEAGLAMEHDPYDIQGEMLELYGGNLRPMVKRLALTAINAKDRKSAYSAFRDAFPTGDPAKKMNNDELDELLKAFLGRNPPLRDAVFSDQGIRLMYKDSQITEVILSSFTQRKVPVLSVHDSYIIDHFYVDALRNTMAQASRATTGFELPTSIKLPDRPEYSDVSSEELREYVDLRRIARPSAGYTNRMKAYEMRTGKDFSPEDWTEEELLAMHNGEW
ncbi:hypothetical protein [Alloyangia pacifica]|nr:hypothetical protein [Alloyangia pacifica]